MNENDQWRVPPRHTLIKAAAAAALLALAAAKAGDRVFLPLAAIAAAGMCGLALRDVLAPVRVAAGPEGLTVISGFARRERIPWAEVTALRVDENLRFGLRARLLEIETARGLHLFSRYDLGADPADVRAALDRLHPHEHGTELS